MKRVDLRAAVDAALSQADEMTTGWCITFERIDADGEQVLVHEISDGLTDWQRVGMLYAALEMGPLLYEVDESLE
ncbi:MAG: hypothetical protein V4510_12815 [bacterium]